MSRASDVQLRMKRQSVDVPASAAGQVSIEVVDVGADPELRMVDEAGVVWPVGSGGGGSGNLDGGSATSTYGGTTAVDGGSA